jgi:hypothetical protein
MTGELSAAGGRTKVLVIPGVFRVADPSDGPALTTPTHIREIPTNADKTKILFIT